MQHILLEKAHVFEKRKETLSPNGYKYDFEKGAWIHSDTGQLLVDSPDMDGLETKKNDVETGEDLKSE